MNFVYPILFTIISQYLIMVLLNKLNRQNNGGNYLRIFYIYRNIIISSFVTALFLTTFISLYYDDYFLSKKSNQNLLLALLLFTLLVAITALIKLSHRYGKGRVFEIIKIAKTSKDRDESYKKGKMALKKIKIFSLLPFVGLLFLAVNPADNKNLISVIIDNSSNMAESANQADARTFLDIANEAITGTLKEVDNHNTIVVTSFKGKGSVKNSIQEILNTNDTGELVANTVRTNSAEFVNGLIPKLERNTSVSIVEPIWQNYLFCRNLSIHENFNKKVLIVVTGGAHILTSKFPTSPFFSQGENFNKLFPISDVFILDIRGSFGKDPGIDSTFSFLYTAKSNGYKIISASTLHECSNALNIFLKGYSRDSKYFFVILTCLLISSLIAFTIQPKRAD